MFNQDNGDILAGQVAFSILVVGEVLSFLTQGVLSVVLVVSNVDVVLSIWGNTSDFYCANEHRCSQVASPVGWEVAHGAVAGISSLGLVSVNDFGGLVDIA